MSRLKNISYIIAAIVLLLMTAFDMQATHIVGGDMTYKCLGNDLYELTLTIRRDCENGADDAPFDDPAIIGVFDIFGSLQTHLGNFGRIEIPFMGEDTITNSVVFDCSAFGNPVCVHESVYRDTLFLPFNKIGYRLAYQRCCRNSILVNIEEPLETGATYHVALPVTVLTECNSQPVFNNWPDVYLCVNEDLSFDHSATDADGDQLVYKLCTPSQGATSAEPQPFTPSNPPYPTVVWSSPYSLTNMMASNPPLSINSATGLLTGGPNLVGTYLVGICVEEYRNGQLLSTVRRDFEFNVRVCTDPIELMCEIDGTDCDGDTFASFTNLSQGADSYRWVFSDQAGDTIFIGNDQIFDYEFPSFGTYTITLEGTRNSDGCTARKIETLVIGDPDVTADFNYQLESCDSLNLIRFTDASFDASMSARPVEWLWTINGVDAGNTSTIIYEPSDSLLEVTLFVRLNSNCTGQITRVINVSDLIVGLDFNFALAECSDDGFLIELQSDHIPDELEIENLVWTIQDLGVTSNYFDDPLLIVISGQNTSITLDVLFENGCQKTVSKILGESDILPSVNFGVNTIDGCPQNGDIINVGLFPIIDFNGIQGNVIEYLWSVNGILYSGEEINFDYLVGSLLDLYLSVTFDNGCVIEFSDQLILDFTPEVVLDVLTECLDSGEVKLTITDITGLEVDSYSWYDLNGELGSDSMFMIILSEDEEREIFLDVSFSNGCFVTTSVLFNSELFRPAIEFDIEVAACDDDLATVNIDFNPSLGVESETIIINGIEYDSLPVQLMISLDSLLNIEYSVEYTNGCSDTYASLDTVRNYLPEIDFDISLGSCESDGYNIILESKVTNSNSPIADLLWTINDAGSITTYTTDPLSLFITGQETEISLYILFENGCSQEITELVDESVLLPQLDILMQPLDSCPEDGDTVVLNFTSELIGGVNLGNVGEYIWVVNGQTYNTEEISIEVLVGDSLEISLQVLFENGCIIMTEEIFDTNFAQEVVLEVQTECLDSGDVKLIITDLTGIEVDSYRWYDLNGELGSDSMFMIILSEDEEREIFVDVSFSNGCFSTASVLFNSELFRPTIEFGIEVSSCSDDLATVFIDYESSIEIESETIIINGVSYDSLPVELMISLDSILSIEYSVEYTNGCSDTYTSSDTVRNYLPEIDIDITLESCVADGYNVILESLVTNGNSPIADLLWTVNDGGVITTYTSDPLGLFISGQDTEVTLFILFENGCSQEITELLNESTLLPQLDIVMEAFDSCPEVGDTVEVKFTPELTGGVNIGNIGEYIWIVNGQTYTTEEISVTTTVGDILEISLQIIFENGCTVTTEETFDTNIAQEVILDVQTECLDSGEVKLIITDITGLDVESYRWYDANGELGMDSMFMIILSEDEEREIFVDVSFSNGCFETTSVLFNSELFRPTIEFDINVSSCDDDIATVNIDFESTLEVDSETIIINGVEYDSLPVELMISLDSILNIEYSVDYTNGCSDTYSSSDTVRNYLPRPAYVATLLECREDGILISLSDSTQYDGDQVTEWVIIDGDSTYQLLDPIDSIFITQPVITVIQNIQYDNGCFDSDTTSLSQDDVLPELDDPIFDYEITPIECFGDSGTFQLSDMTVVPECIYIVDQFWVINGDSCVGSPVIKTLPLGEDISFSYTVIFNTGLILSTSSDTIIANDTINTNQIVDTIGIEIINLNPGSCSDSLNLAIVNPDSSVNYQWATDIDFNNILGEGSTLDTVGGALFNGVIYVQTTDNFGDCVYGLDSILVNNEFISISFDMPYVLCPGDTAQIQIINNNSNQTIDYLWKGDGGQLISGEDTANPLIGVSEDSQDDFFLVLCTSNNFGCSSIDTIRFEIGERDSLVEFTYAIDSCGSLIVMFDESPNLIGDNAVWDFGDGSFGFGSNPIHEYDTTGIYTVTLMDTSLVCSSLPVSVDIFVGMLYLEILPDTIFYDADSTVTVFAETNGIPDSIKWCTLDGVTVGMGNPLSGFDAMMDTVVLIAKIDDGFGCTDRDTVVLIPDMNPEDCLNSIEITGPDQEAFCAGEEVQLCITALDDCDLEEFDFLWNPDDCIVAGQGTPKITVVADASKTIMVLVTHIESGLDSIYAFELVISNPDPQISVPDINLDENNNVIVCLGQSIVLTVDPEDPDCEYTWSDGTTGPSIEITPDEDFIISVQCVDAFGCVGVSDSLSVSVIPPQCDETDIFLPNAFSPNGDNVNDVLFVRSKFIETMELVIVNRWGQEVFRSTDQSIGWDGTFNGERLGPDAFSFSLSVVCVGGQTYVKTGNVSIII